MIDQSNNLKDDKKAKKEAEKLAKQKAKQEAKEAKERAKREVLEAEERAIREAEEARRVKIEEEKARKEAEKLAKQKAKQQTEQTENKEKKEEKRETLEIDIAATNETVDKEKTRTKKIVHRLYEGEVKLLLTPPVDSKHLKELEGKLQNTKGLRILLTGGTADGGIQMVVLAGKPAPLLNVLREVPQVEEVISKDDSIFISFK